MKTLLRNSPAQRSLARLAPPSHLNALGAAPALCRLLIVLSAAALATAGAIADAPPQVRRSVIRAAEISLNDRLARIFPDTPIAVTGQVRGVYIDGFGAVFTAEMNPVSDGTSLMHAVLRPDEKAQVKAKKIARIPELKKGMKEALVETAASLDPVPLDDQVVLEVVIDRFLWEDGSGYPSELLVQAPRRKLLDLKRAGNSASALDAAIKLTER